MSQQHDERRLAASRARACELDQAPPAAQRGAQRARAGRRARRAGRGAKRRVRHLVDRQAQPRDRRAWPRRSRPRICSKSLSCSTSRSETVKRRVDLDLRLLLRLGASSCCRAAPRRGAARPARRLRPSRRRRRPAAAASRSSSRAARGCARRCGTPGRRSSLLVPLHEDGVQRPVEIVALADAAPLDRRDRIEHRPGPTAGRPRAARGRNARCSRRAGRSSSGARARVARPSAQPRFVTLRDARP